VKLFCSIVCFFLLGVYANAQIKFSHNTSAPSLGGPDQIVTADFDRDGNVDFAVAFNGAPGNGGTIVYFNDGLGNVARTVTINSGLARPSGITVADVNHDGNPDLVETFSNGPTLIYLNDGEGNLTQSGKIEGSDPANFITSIAAGNLKGDGFSDLIIEECTSGFANCFYNVYLNNFGHGFSLVQTIQTEAHNIPPYAQPVLVDLNEDGTLDLALVDGTDGILTYLGKGDGTFTPDKTIPSPYGLRILTADFNGDSAPDLAVLSSVGVFIYLNDGDGGLTYSGSITSVYGPTTTFAAGDLNEDGKQDLIFSYGVPKGTNGDLVYALGNGDGTFGSPTLLTEQITSGAITVRDLNHDGRNDIITGLSSYPNGTIDILINRNESFRCGTPSSHSDTTQVCNPKSGATVLSPVLVSASTNSPFQILRSELWINGVKKYQTLSDQLQNSVTLPVGKYSFTYVAVDTTGTYAKTHTHVTVVADCAIPAFNRIHICQPSQNADANSEVVFRAATNTSGFTANRLYVDNQPVFFTNSQQVLASLKLESGSHRLVVVSYNNSGQAFTASRTITVR
jgi:hypothetical protein